MSPVRIYGDQGYLELAGPTQAGNTTLIMPSGTGTSGQYLQTNGAGATSWQTVTVPAQTVVQVVHGSITTSFTSTDGNQLTVASINITPTTTTSIILLNFGIQVGVGSSQADTNYSVRINDGTNNIAEWRNNTSNATGYNYILGSTFSGVDVPGVTSQVTYNFQITRNTGSGPVVANAYNQTQDFWAMEVLP